MIPVFDITRQNRILKKELNDAISSVIEGGIFILGPKVSEFEERFAKYIGVKYTVGVASGTDALILALLNYGIGAGDEVIVPANSYPSAFAISSIGAIPKLVDIDPKTFNIDPVLIEKAITNKTKAIIPVHLYGGPADINRIITIGKKFAIPIIEDCAQAHGASTLSSSDKTFFRDAKGSTSLNESLPPKLDKNSIVSKRQTFSASQKAYTSRERKVGSIGDIGCFSFYPTKNLGCFGDGGMVVTNNPEIYKKIKLLRMYGEAERYKSVLLGKNSRLDEIQAAILLVKLKYLDKWIERRREIAKIYSREFAEFVNSAGPASRVSHALAPSTPSDIVNVNHKDLVTRYSGARRRKPSLVSPAIVYPIEAKGINGVYHLYVIRTNNRDELKDYLEKNGIGSAIHYPTPIHLVESFKYLGYKKGDFPESERASGEILSLPMYPELTDEEVKKVVKIIRKFYD